MTNPDYHNTLSSSTRVLPAALASTVMVLPQIFHPFHMLCNDLLQAHLRDIKPCIIPSFQSAIRNVNTFLQDIEHVRKLLKNLKSRVEASHKDYKIASTISSGTSIAGSVASVAGILLMPFTAGLSGAMTVGGLAATFGGGVGSLANDIRNNNEIQ